jgi:hypothetical protein
MNPLGVLWIAIGVFALCGAVFDWQWFMNHPKTRFFTSILGRTGARKFYGLLGIGLVVLGVLFAYMLIPDTR